MQLKSRFTPALCGVALLVVMTFPVRAETLSEAVQMTLSSHPSVTKAKVGSSVAEEEKREERSGYFPQLGITGQTGRIYGDNSTSRGLTTTRGSAWSNYWEGTVTARQMLFDGFETTNRVDSKQAKIKAAAANVMDTGERLAFSVVQAYLDLLRSRKALEMISAYAKKVGDYEGRIKGMVDDGAADEAEYQQARDIKVILDNMQADYTGQVRMAEAYYTELTGNLPAEALVMPDAPSDIPGTVEEAIAFARTNNPGLQSADLMSQSAAYEAKAERAALYPDIDGELSYLESDKEEVLGGEVTDGRAVVRLNWDFETGGGQLARIEQKKLHEKEAKASRDELERQIERSLRLAYAEYLTASQQLDSQDKREALNEKLFETYNVQFEGARITLLQLMQSDNQLFTTQVEKLNGTFRVLAARYAILAGMGRLRDSLNVTTAQAAIPASPLTGPSADDKK